MNDGHLMEYSQITDLIYIGSDLCDGLVCPIHGKEFEELGICGEVNLEEEHPETPPKHLDAYLWLPVKDGEAPRPDQLMIGTAAINEMVGQNNVVYVHCKNGHGRSPTLVAAYLIRYKGKSIEEAIQLIASKRPEVHIEDTQRQALEQFASKWK